MARRARAVAIPAGVAESSPAAVKARGRRITFVDLLRLIASFQMVTGHTIDGLLVEELRQGAVFERWTFVRGLTSVAFMVAAGLSYHLSTLARFERHKSDPANVRRRLRRGAWLVILGYLLHFPGAIFGDDPAMAARALHEATIADVLQCIGLSILALEGLTLLARRPRQVVWAALALAGLAFGLAPLLDAVTPEGPWRFALNYLTHRGGSLFPLLPWAGYVFAGVAIGALALPKGARTDPAVPPLRLAACAVGILAVAFALSASPLLDAAGVAKNAQPAFTTLKLGLVVGFVALLALASQRLGRLPGPLQALAGESLMLYVSHLLVLYAGTFGLYRILGHSLALPEALGAAAAMTVGAAAVGLGWHRLKARWRAWRRGPTAG
ncbi:MAG TPA: heparan-alpha-glucosaminide N-acetyltransferase domain-containing protein [Sandaracinaceae bacterium LLY-WYZ-13_1]|nr:heparan-alpha-glucosaminide N-acetyltransferase domain-containing protein [Sandaracinaceae bacterium LLY-WYZ-13_1]